MKDILVVAPHADDEVLGCGGSLLKWKSEGHRLHWLLVTKVHEQVGFDKSRQGRRALEISAISDFLGFDTVNCLNFPSAQLDQVSDGELIAAISGVVTSVAPSDVLLPFWGDAHTDHYVTFSTASACTKIFRYPYVKRVLAYETLSETDFGFYPNQNFQPNLFVDISGHLKRKIDAMGMYPSEMGIHPFPRSEKSIEALATLRGTQAGTEAAEAFMIIKEREL